jgi:hypothetical protein
MGNPEDELWLQELENPAIPFHKQEDEEEQPTAEKNESLYFQVNTSLANNQASGKDILKKGPLQPFNPQISRRNPRAILQMEAANAQPILQERVPRHGQ